MTSKGADFNNFFFLFGIYFNIIYGRKIIKHESEINMSQKYFVIAFLCNVSRHVYDNNFQKQNIFFQQKNKVAKVSFDKKKQKSFSSISI